MKKFIKAMILTGICLTAINNVNAKVVLNEETIPVLMNEIKFSLENKTGYKVKTIKYNKDENEKFDYDTWKQTIINQAQP